MGRFATVNYGSPVNPGAPLNAGRLAWWLALPNWSGAGKWFDLCGKSLGTLTNGPIWQRSNRPGGWGHVLFDGTDDHVVIPKQDVSNGVTIAAWFNPSSVSGRHTLVHNGQVLLLWNGTDIEWFPNDGLTQVTLTGGLVIGKWYRLLVSQTGTAYAAYLNGQPIGSGTTVALNNSAEAVTSIGQFSAAWFLQGLADDVSIWGRGLSAAEARADFVHSSQGYVRELNRVGRRRMIAQQAAAAGGSSGPWPFFMDPHSPAASSRWDSDRC
jgi:hypothetical protein